MNSIIILGSAFALTYLFVSTSQRVGRWADQHGLVPENYAASLVHSRDNIHRQAIEPADPNLSAGPHLG